MPKNKQKITIIHIVLFADTIMEYFDEAIKGIASDIAYFEVLLGAEKYFKKPNKKFEEYLKFTLGIEKSDFAKIKQSYKKKVKDIKKYKLF